jgi:HEAT repeat protein
MSGRARSAENSSRDGGQGEHDRVGADETELHVTVAELIDGFRDQDLRQGHAALAAFNQLPDKKPFLAPLCAFLGSERNDFARGWAASAIASIGGPQAYNCLLSFLRGDAQPEPLTAGQRRAARYTRFYALLGLARLSRTQEQQQTLADLLTALRADRDEDLLVVAGACLLAAERGDEKALGTVREMLGSYRSEHFRPAWSALRALRELPQPRLRDPVLDVLRDSRFSDHRLQAIRILGNFAGDLRVIAELSNCLRTSSDSFLRLEAAIALGRLADHEAQEALLTGLCDENAEVRVQAAAALGASSAGPDEAVAAIITRALLDPDSTDGRRYYLDAIRALDRAAAAELLRKEMSSDDEQRAKLAETLLIDLGGWAAVQRLSQRRATLKDLDALLEKSEDVVKDTFKDTIEQARRNFYFAMTVNVLVVIVGLALIAIALSNLINQPDRLASWILPGSAGVIGIILNMTFHDPRQHAREDLTALMNVNVIFLGYLRQVNQIDATFKHAYMERSDFGLEQMQHTVKQLEQAVRTTLTETQTHLGASSNAKTVKAPTNQAATQHSETKT